MYKLQMAHDFSIEILRGLLERLELLAPIIGLASIIILCIVMTVLILISVIESIINARNKRK